jgi:hypothetical protein
METERFCHLTVNHSINVLTLKLEGMCKILRDYDVKCAEMYHVSEI